MRTFIIRVRHLFLKEFTQALRDPRMRMLLFVPPIVQLILFGYAANLDLKHIPAAVYDESRSQLSRDLADTFAASGYFDLVAHVDRDGEMAALLNKGTVKAALHFGPNLAGRLGGGRPEAVQIIVAGTDSNTAAMVQSYSVQIVQGYNQRLLARQMNRNPAVRSLLDIGSGGLLDARVRFWYNPDLSSVRFYVPGIIGLLILMLTLMLTSMAVVREKEIGTMEQIMVTPIRPAEFILGKTLPFAVIGFVQVFLVTTVGVFWFGVAIQGSLLLLAVSLLIYVLSALAIGLLISTISRTQQQALLTTFFFFMPAVLLSGFIFPIANMPFSIQVLTYLNPLRYALVVIRGIFLKGAGLDVLWPQLLALLILGTGLMALAVSRVRKTLD
jgi:ABC-2 type transport system permease protein